MSARSRYLEAISPRNENNSSDDVMILSPTKVGTNNNMNSTIRNVNNNNNSVTAPSWQQKQKQPPPPTAAASPFGLKRTSSVKSPSSIAQQRTTGRNTNVYINSAADTNNNNTANAPPPPPPPGMPVKRKKNSSSAVKEVVAAQQHDNDTDDNNNDDNDDKPKQSSPIRAKGEQWSPRDEIQSGNVQKYKTMLWGNTASAAAALSPTPPDSPVANAVKNLEAKKSLSSSPGGAAQQRGVGGNVTRRPPAITNPTSTITTSTTTSTSPFYKRTAPVPIVTNRITTSTSSSLLPTPPSRVGVRQQQQRGGGGGGGGVSPSPGGGSGGNNNNNLTSTTTTTTPLHQRMGNLNISPLITSFDNEKGQQQQQQQQHENSVGLLLQQQPPSSSSLSPMNQQQQQQQGITTITAFKRPNHKVGIIFTRQSSSSADVAIIARILPDSIFAQHDEAERRSSLGSGGGGGMGASSSSALLGGGGLKTRGLEGSEVIAVNGVPVRNPKHAAEMVAKAMEEVRLTICKRGGGGGAGGGVDYGKSSLSPKATTTTTSSSSPKVPRLNNEYVESSSSPPPQSRQEEEEGHPTGDRQYHYYQMPKVVTKSRSIDEDSSFSVRTEGPEQQQQQQLQLVGMIRSRSGEGSGSSSSSRKELASMAITETANDERLQRSDQLFIVNRGSPTKQQQQQQQRGGVTEKKNAAAAVAAAAKKSKEIADMRRKVAQAMLMSQEMVHDPVVDDGNNNNDDVDDDDDDDDDSEEDNNWATPQLVKQHPSELLTTKKKKIAAPALSPSKNLAERRRQAALNIYNSQEMVGDNVDDVALGTVDIVGVMKNKETIGGSGGLPPPHMPIRVNSFGNTSVVSKARTDVTTESMATQRMGTSPKIKASSQSGEEETFQFDDGHFEEEEYISNVNERNAAALASAITSPVKGTRRVEWVPQEMAASQSATVSKSIAAAPRSPARESVTESPGRRGLFGKMKSQKKSSKMFGGVKNILKPQKFMKSKTVDRGIPLEDSHSNEEDRMDTIEPTVARYAVAAAAPPPQKAEPAENHVTNPNDDVFAPPIESKSWGDDFFRDPFANSPFNDPAKGDPFGFPATERAMNSDADAFFDNVDSWGEPQTLPDVNLVDSSDNLSHDEMSEITNPTFISRMSNRRELTRDSKENYSTENKGVFAGEQAEVMLKNHVAKEQAEAMRTRMLNNHLADLPIIEMPTLPSSEDAREDKVVSNLMAKSRIISKYGKNRKVARGADSSDPIPPTEHNLLPPRRQSNATRSPVVKPSGQSGRKELAPAREQAIARQRAIDIAAAKAKQEAAKELAVAREQAIARQRAIDIAAAKAKQSGVSSPYSSKGYRGRSSPHMLDNSSFLASSSRSPTSYNYPRQKKKTPPSVIDNPSYYSVENYLLQIKDPIQRAGVRLLWAAAIPIQTVARRFLARQHAIKRMCAVLTIQSFIRRWNAERNLEIAVWSAIQIQAAYRGWFARDSLEDNHYCATQIQRITRGYLATMHVFEDLYSITIVQSVVRRFLAINLAVDRLSSIIAIQAWFRGIRAREVADEKVFSAIAIQSTWRRYVCQMTYQFDIIDIIIAQSIVRRKQAMQLRKKTAAIVRIQALARAIIARNKFVRAKSMRYLVTRHTSATKIQSCWRSYSAQVKMLTTIVNIIVIQSLWRRRSVEKIYKPHLYRIKLAKQRKRNSAATKIQSIWRGFSVFSGYTIIRYENQAATIIQSRWRGYLQSTNYFIMLMEIVRIQAFVRGRQERSWLAFQHECASIIQASMRGYLTRKELHNERMISVLISAAATSLRMRNAAKTLQRWWVDVKWKQKQKKSALIIERFFIYVKKEVEKEIKAMKKKKRQRKKMKKYMQSDDWLLENAWQGLEAASVDASTFMPANAPAVPIIPYDRGQQHQQQYVDNRSVRSLTPPPNGRVLPPSGGAPIMSGPPPQANYAVHATTNNSIPSNNSIRQQHGYRGRRYDRTDDDSLALEAAFAEASAHDSHLVSSNQYHQRQSSTGYRGRRYN